MTGHDSGTEDVTGRIAAGRTLALDPVGQHGLVQESNGSCPPGLVNDAESYVETLPAPQLVGRVRTVWVQHTGPRPYLQRHLPTGGVELHCPLGGLPRLIGPLTAAKVQVLPPSTTVVGARFWPGAASPVLGLPLSELVNLTVELDDLWRGTAVQLGGLLADAPRPQAALDVLQRFLVSQQARRRPGSACLRRRASTDAVAAGQDRIIA